MNINIEKQAFWILKNINLAIRKYAMIQQGDRVAVAVSGGKDSLSLLRLLDLRRYFVPESYDLIAIHVTADARGVDTPHHLPLLEWLEHSGYNHKIIPVESSGNEILPMNCQRCTWNRRKVIFKEAIKLGCSSIAFGHHADDLAQTTLINLLYSGKVETMAPSRTYFDGIIKLIRPLFLTWESDIRRFAKLSNFPSQPPDCPQKDQSRRELAKEIINFTSRKCKDTRVNLLRAGLRGNDS